MTELRIRRHWAPWWIALIVGGLYLFFGSVVVQAFQDPVNWGPGIRIFIPLYALVGYWVLAVVANSREALVTPDCVSVHYGPFPTGGSKTLPREKIWLCYARNVVTYEDGHEISNFYMSGVETAHGVQVDVSGPYKTSEQALRAAYDIIRVLNARPGRSAIEVRGTSTTPSDTARKWRVLAWLAAFLSAIFIGAMWEIAAGSL